MTGFEEDTEKYISSLKDKGVKAMSIILTEAIVNEQGIETDRIHIYHNSNVFHLGNMVFQYLVDSLLQLGSKIMSMVLLDFLKHNKSLVEAINQGFINEQNKE